MKDGELVMPGSFLGVVEEFLPGRGAFEEDGKIYASTIGIAQYDMKGRRAEVKPVVKQPPTPTSGDTVICQVVLMREKMALVDILALEGYEDREVTGSTKARIYISQTAQRYVKDLASQFHANDTVRARVRKAEREPYELSTASSDLGVVRALCSKCRTVLKRKGNVLECPECGNIEMRKLASDYGKGRV
jgi:exosome complex component CSL4